LTASAQGIDVSSYQPVLTVDALSGLDFCFVKATNGDRLADENFAANWATLKAAGLHRGAYHELVSPAVASAKAQAQYFLACVVAEGLEAGDMLAVVASDYQGVTDSEVKAFCDAIHAAAPASPVLVYSDLDVAKALGSCTGYPLWVAWPSDTAPDSVAPWKTWTFWQWSETALDRDAYNGTAAELQAWLDSVACPVTPADWTFRAPRDLKATGGRTSVKLTWSEPAGAPENAAQYNVFIYRGTTTCNTSTLVPSYPRAVTKTEFIGGSLARGGTYTAHVVAEGPDNTRVAPDTYASVTFTTG
jgi:GH25 family lysozyme M1 (1,4-beta-N-acetylmuramidase)